MPSLQLPTNADKQEIKQAYQAAMNLLDSGIDGWATMTATQKNAWIGANFDAVMRVIRGQLRLLGIMLQPDDLD